MKQALIISIIIGFSTSLTAQQEVSIFVDGDYKESVTWENELSQKAQIKAYLNMLWADGYIFSSVDSLSTKGIYFHAGEQIMLSHDDERVKYQEIISEAKKELEIESNLGYPFAHASWDYDRKEDGLAITYSIDQGPFVLYDSIILLSPIETKRGYLEKVLEIEKGVPFSENSFQRLPKRIERVSFIQSVSDPDISFQSNKVWTYLDLEENPTGRFEGVLGILPNQGSQDRSLVTGSLDLSLSNLFGSGKEFDLFWNRFNQESQKLEIRYAHPFFLNSDLSLESKMNLLRQDTSFITAKFGFGANWFVGNNLKMGITYEKESSDVLLSQSDQIIDRGLQDFDQDWYGLSLESHSGNEISLRDYNRFLAQVDLGQRTIIKNINLSKEFYNTLNLVTTNWRFEFSFELQKKYSRNAAFYSETNLAYVGNGLQVNSQLFRVGGLKTLRGFNEQFFFVNTYLVNQLEWRLFFEKESYVFGFFDQGLIKNREWESPTGLGMGLTIQTNSSLFSFAIAIGRSNQIPFEPSNAKVHFGYISRF